MRFEDLYTVMNEVPYYVVPDTTNLDGVTYIDYKVECWAEVAFELKKSFVNILTELNKLEVLVDVKAGIVEMVFGNNRIPFTQYSPLIDMLRRQDIPLTTFNNVILANHSRFEYV